MEDVPRVKPPYWVGNSKKDLLAAPEEVIDVFGYALYLAQIGKKHEQAKPLKGFGSAGVLEVVEDWQGNAYRAIYTVRFTCGVFVLHVFQKKSKRGIATPKADLDLIRERLRAAEQVARELERWGKNIARTASRSRKAAEMFTLTWAILIQKAWS